MNWEEALVRAASKGHIETVTYLCEKIEDVREEVLNDALWASAWEGHMEVVKKLTIKGATDMNGARTLAHVRRHKRLNKFLRKRGGRVDMKLVPEDEEYESPDEEDDWPTWNRSRRTVGEIIMDKYDKE